MALNRRNLLAGGVALAGFTAAADARASDTLTIASGGQGNWENAVCGLGQTAGFFRRHGLDLSIVYTQGSGETMQAVISGSADIGIGVGTASAIGAYAKGAPIRAIANQTTGAPAAFWYVPASSPIRTLADAAGRTIAFSTIGSSNHAVLLSLLKETGIAATPVATGGAPGTFTQVMSGQVDIGYASPPFALEAVDDSRIRILARGSDISSLRDRTVRLQITHARVWAGRREAIERYLGGYGETLDWMYADPAALAAYSASVGIPEAVTRRMRDEFYPRRDLDPKRLSGVRESMAEAVTFKYMPAPLDAERLAGFFTYADPGG